MPGRTFLFLVVVWALAAPHASADVAASPQSVVFAGTLSATGKLTASVSIKAENSELQGSSVDTRRAMASFLARLQVDDVAASADLEGEEMPFLAAAGFRYRLTVRQYASLVDPTSARLIPRLLLLHALDAWSPEVLAELPKDAPLTTDAPATFDESTTIDFDQSWEVVLPKPTAIDRPFAAYQSTYQVQGTRVTVSRRLDIKQAKVPATLRPQVSAFAKAVAGDLAAKATWRRRDASGPGAAVSVLGAGELLDACREALTRRDVKKARELALQAKAKDPENGEAWLLLGMSEVGLRHPAEAEAALKKAVDLGTPGDQALMALGQLYTAQRRWADGAQLFQQVVQRNPRNVKAQERLGQCLGLLGRYEESIAPFRAYLEALPDDSDGYYALAGAYVYSGHSEQARELLLKGVARFPGQATQLRFATMLAEEELDTSTARQVAQETLDAAAKACRTVTLDRPPDDYPHHLAIAAYSYRVLGMVAAVDGEASAVDLLRTSFDLIPDPRTAKRIARVLGSRSRSQEGFRYYALSVQGRDAERVTFDDVPEELRPWAKKTYGSKENLRSAVGELGRDRLFLRRIRPSQGDLKMPKGGVKPSGVTFKARVLVGEDGSIQDARFDGGSEPYLSAARSDLARLRFQPVGPEAARFKTLRSIEFFYLPTPEVRAFWEFELAPTEEAEDK